MFVLVYIYSVCTKVQLQTFRTLCEIFISCCHPPTSYFHRQKYKHFVVLSQGRFLSMFSILASVNFRKVLEPTLMYSMGDSVIFQHEVLKTLTKNDPGSELRNVCTCSHIFCQRKGGRMTTTQMCVNYEIYVQLRGGVKHNNYNSLVIVPYFFWRQPLNCFFKRVF